jgi:hypothetical protein
MGLAAWANQLAFMFSAHNVSDIAISPQRTIIAFAK